MLQNMREGNPGAEEELLCRVYNELRTLAASKLCMRPGCAWPAVVTARAFLVERSSLLQRAKRCTGPWSKAPAARNE